jgi:hypothetical protein
LTLSAPARAAGGGGVDAGVVLLIG